MVGFQGTQSKIVRLKSDQPNLRWWQLPLQICEHSVSSLPCQSVSEVAGGITVLNLETSIGFSCGPAHVCVHEKGRVAGP